MKRFGFGMIVILLVLVLYGSASPQVMLYTYLRQDLKFRIGENTPNMTDALYDSCICWAANAMRSHGLARYDEGGPINLPANTQFMRQTFSHKILFFQSLTVVPDVGALSGLYERGLPQIDIKDVGHGKLATDSPHSFCFQYFQQDTARIFIYPSKTDADTFFYSYYQSWDGNVVNSLYIPADYKEALLSYASMWIWLRMENYQMAADAYNNYQREINILRQEKVNWIPDVSIAPQITE